MNYIDAALHYMVLIVGYLWTAAILVWLAHLPVEYMWSRLRTDRAFFKAFSWYARNRKGGEYKPRNDEEQDQ